MCKVVMIVILAGVAGARIQISLKPSFVYIPAETDVRIRCSVDATLTGLDRVYSIILQKSQQTIIVAGGGQKIMFYDPDYSDALVSSDFSGSSPYLEVTLKNVTCRQRQNYGCKAAARKGNHNMKLQTELLRLNVIGEECKVDYNVAPNKASYDTEEEVSVTLFTFTKRIHRIEWQCFYDHEDKDILVPPAGTCDNETVDGMYNCSAQFLLTVNTKPYRLECGIGDDKTMLDLNVDRQSASQEETLEVNDWHSSEPYQSLTAHRKGVQVENIITVVLGVTAATVLVIVLIVIVAWKRSAVKSRRKRICDQQQPLHEEDRKHVCSVLINSDLGRTLDTNSLTNVDKPHTDGCNSTPTDSQQLVFSRHSPADAHQLTSNERLPMLAEGDSTQLVSTGHVQSVRPAMHQFTRINSTELTDRWFTP